MNTASQVVAGQQARAIQPNAVEPIKLWAAFGAVVALMLVYVYGGWITGPDFTPNTTGREFVPQWQRIYIRSIEVISASMFVICNYIFVYRPWRRDGELSNDGLLVLAAATMYWQDTLVNYTSYYSQLNTYFINFGYSANYIPGWITPNQGQLPEAIIAWGCAYGAWFILLPVLIGSKLLNWLHARNSSMSKFKAIMIMLGVFIAFDFLLEGTIVATGLYIFAGAVRSLSLFPGTVHQFPIYEAVFVGSMLTTITALWYYRDDKGYTLVERGAEKLKYGKRTIKFMRWLALVGFLNLVMVVQVGIPINLIQLHADDFPEGVPPYLQAGLCGEGNAYACPSSDLPIANRHAPTNRTISAEELAKITAGKGE